jgi:hypothetical protein
MSVMHSITCHYCGEAVSAHWEALEHTDCTPGNGPAARRQWAVQQAEISALHAEFQARDVEMGDGD